MKHSLSLHDIFPQQSATVISVQADESMRRRLLDLGLTPGTEVKCLGSSPLGDPRAYLIRGAVIALRARDSQKILVEPSPAFSTSVSPQKVIALAGNPNVGKSTIFNALTGMNQHTGNWPGKTVSTATGLCHSNQYIYQMVDIPGTYSLFAHSPEEEVARDFLCFGQPDAVIVVCDATCLERNLNLVLQTLEITSRVIVCVNLMDEARRKKIHVDLTALSHRLGVPVIGTVARKKETLDTLLNTLDEMVSGTIHPHPPKIRYPQKIEQALQMLEPMIGEQLSDPQKPLSRWLSLRLLEQDDSFVTKLEEQLDIPWIRNSEITKGIQVARKFLTQEGITTENWADHIVPTLVSQAERICRGTLTFEKASYRNSDRIIDRILTSRLTGFPIMILSLALLFWLTIEGANYPSALLADGLFWIQDRLTELFVYIHAPGWLHGILVLGLYRVLAWVISVMLPPMAIFFPLFTLLEDAGYLPRVAYNLDQPFQRCRACGKQCLSMCMGLGCNAVGVTGCRIIDSPRERLLAILTNNLIPCNGRFPSLIAIITMFFSGMTIGFASSVRSALLLTGIIVLGILLTFFITWLLSSTILKGIPSAFTLELPPYRRPQVGRVIVRSVFDRTLFVLVRAACVAAPAGMFLWVMANVSIHGQTLLQCCASFLHPLGNLMGMDGVILTAFLLGFPANEIVLPIILMAYTSQGSLTADIGLTQMRNILLQNGWTQATALCTLVFFLLHWPCSTTLLTIKKETGSLRWTALAAILPTSLGIILCVFLNFLMKIVIIS